MFFCWFLKLDKLVLLIPQYVKYVFKTLIFLCLEGVENGLIYRFCLFMIWNFNMCYWILYIPFFYYNFADLFWATNYLYNHCCEIQIEQLKKNLSKKNWKFLRAIPKKNGTQKYSLMTVTNCHLIVWLWAVVSQL